MVGGGEGRRRVVTAGGRRMGYLTSAGSEAAPAGTLVLLHGAGASARSWMGQLRGLAPALRVLAVDLPGRGESDPVREATVETYAEAVRGVLDAVADGAVVLAGHSLGGGVALAARHPELVRGLILVSSCAKLPADPDAAATLFWYAPRPLRRLLARWLAAEVSGLPGPVRRALVLGAARRLLVAPGASAEAVRSGMTEVRSCRPETILQDVAAARAMDLEASARALRVPTLVLCGSRDRLTPVALSRRLRDLIPGARLLVIEGAGHMLPLEMPEAVNQAILDFLGAVGGPGVRRPGRAVLGQARSLARRLVAGVRALLRSGRRR